MITHGMRALVPVAGQDRFLTVVRGEEELKKAVNFSADADTYIVVLDAAGNIVFYTHGEPSETSKKQVIDRIKDN
jgi:predicted transcriptional regulator